MKTIVSSSSELVDQLTKVVGKKNIESDQTSVLEHSKNMLPKDNLCKSIVYPGNTDEIKKIFKIAANHNSKVWCFSGGNNWGYGTKNGSQSNAIILILKRMNQIIEVNEKMAYAVIEPGVTQEQLNNYLKENNIDLWIDCTDSTPRGSLLGNASDRGIGYTRYGDHFGHLCGMEIVLPTGEECKLGVSKNSKTTYTHKWGHGAFLDGIFTQSNLGIITRVGLWLMRKPKYTLLYTMDISTQEKLGFVLDQNRELGLKKILQGHPHTVNNFQMATVACRPTDFDTEERLNFISKKSMDKIYDKYKIPAWSMVGSIYGDDKYEIEFRKKALKKAYEGLGSLEFFDAKKVSKIQKFVKTYENTSRRSFKGKILKTIKSFITDKPLEIISLLPEMFNVVQGIPTEKIIKSAYFKSNTIAPDKNADPASDECGVIWLAPTFPTDADHFHKLINLIRPLYVQYNFNFSACITRLNDRTSFLLAGIFYNKQDQNQRDKANHLHETLTRVIYEQGYPPYRSGMTSWKELENFNQPFNNLVKRIKKTLDPNNIYAPTKYGA